MKQNYNQVVTSGIILLSNVVHNITVETFKNILCDFFDSNSQLEYYPLSLQNCQ